MKDTALVLEGGGMRGIYTAGVLEYFLENDINFPYVAGVSAGACHAFSYISKQKGRNRRIMIDYINDKRYLSFRNYFKEKSLFGMNFIFDEIPNNLVKFDYETFENDNRDFYIGVTDIVTGESIYYNKKELNDPNLIVRASSSLPLVSPIVEYENKKLLDGAIADPIPIEKALRDGYEKFVVVLTRNLGYKKEKDKSIRLAKRFYKKYPNLIKLMETRHEVYNRQLDLIDELEKQGRAIVIRPSEKLQVDRFTKDKNKLEGLYKLGYLDGKKIR